MSELHRRKGEQSRDSFDGGPDAALPGTRSSSNAIDISAGGLVDAIKEKVTQTLAWHELEEWQRDNEYITAGYRR
jgi:hypothetical protein